MLYTITDIVGNNVVKGVPASQIPTEYGKGWPNTTAVNLFSKVPVEIGGTYSFKPRSYSLRGSFIRGELDYKAERIDNAN